MTTPDDDRTIWPVGTPRSVAAVELGRHLFFDVRPVIAVDLAKKVIAGRMILNREPVEQRSLRNLSLPHHRPIFPVLEKIESARNDYFNSEFSNTIRQLFAYPDSA